MNSAKTPLSPAAIAGLNAILIFSIQPSAAKILASKYGTSSTVWLTSLFFYQALLLTAYIYASYFTTKNRSNFYKQHITLTCLVAAYYAIKPDAITSSSDLASPTNIFLELLTQVGPAYFLCGTHTLSCVNLAINSQPENNGLDLYRRRIYGLSSLSGLASVVAYPILTEPHLSNTLLFRSWPFFAIATGSYISWLYYLNKSTLIKSTTTNGTLKEYIKKRSLRSFLLYIPSGFLLTSASAHIIQEKGSDPIYWAAPLSVFLLAQYTSFNYRTDDKNFHFKILMLCGTMISIVVYTGQMQNFILAPAIVISLYCSTAIPSKMVANMENGSDKSVWIYSSSSLGCVTGCAIAIYLPVLTNMHLIEFFIALAASILLYSYALREKNSLLLPSFLSAAALVISASHYSVSVKKEESEFKRNFYGTTSVRKYTSSTVGSYKVLFSGRAIHGMQPSKAPHKNTAYTYYGKESGVGNILTSLPSKKSVGVVGLGAGTIASYGEEGDIFYFFEIDPAIISVAKNDFTYLSESKATIHIVRGDGRTSIRRGKNYKFDALIIDAFNGTHIPQHLLTLEAVEEYAMKLKDTGSIIFHISSPKYEFRPLLESLGSAAGLNVSIICHAPELPFELPSIYAIMTRSIKNNKADNSSCPKISNRAQVARPWTDSRSSIIDLML